MLYYFQKVCEGQPTKATRMMQAEEAVSRIKVYQKLPFIVYYIDETFFVRSLNGKIWFYKFSRKMCFNLILL